MKKITLQQALEDIRRKNKQKMLLPVEVVSAASAPNHPLHSRFTWDDTEAAHQHRLWQARQLIRTVVILTPHSSKPVEAYVSMREDRGDGAGYRFLTEVMSEPDSRASLLSQALEEAKDWQERYRHLKELADVFSAIKKVNRRSKVDQAAMVSL